MLVQIIVIFCIWWIVELLLKWSLSILLIIIINILFVIRILKVIIIFCHDCAGPPIEVMMAAILYPNLVLDVKAC
jgi:hypothetical protein